MAHTRRLRTPLGTALRTTTMAVSAVSGLTCPVRAQGFITLHSYGQKILYPWAYTDVRPDDFDQLDRVAKSMSAKIYEKTLKTYEIGSAASVLYRISGKPFCSGPTSDRGKITYRPASLLLSPVRVYRKRLPFKNSSVIVLEIMPVYIIL